MSVPCPRCKIKTEKNDKFCRECGLSFYSEDIPTEVKILTSGTILANRYEIIKKIKKGGMGTVYKVNHINLNKVFALKELLTLNIAEIEERNKAVERFEKEVKILSELNNKHLPSIIDHFSIGDRCYIVMDFIEGRDLRAILEEEGNPGLPEEKI